MDVTSPHVYARTVEAARALSDELSGRDERNAVVAFQSALAILERARLTQEIDRPPPRSLLLSLADVIDPPRTRRQGAAVRRDHAVDDHDDARRAAAARAAR
jgi:hypothetical protein